MFNQVEFYITSNVILTHVPKAKINLEYTLILEYAISYIIIFNTQFYFHSSKFIYYNA